MTIFQILTKYWGYNKFRPLQEDIINSVLEGKDTLALLPTGGGKSICFQVPALYKEGICIVISPLIALMKDQVQNLVKRNIPAIAIYSGLSNKEIDIALDNCIYGDIKFLYMSPERLSTDIAKERISRMNVNLIAVDESHCISQWGYDFRPSYLNIAEIRNILPNTTILALTATATPKVVEDIQDKLKFKTQNVLKNSFERKNLIYSVLFEENKLNRVLRIINNVNGSGLIYVRNRKKTKEIADFLIRNKIPSDYYHAGLSNLERDIKQDKWIKGTTKVIVATNAFGMGIDKSNCRFVIHYDLPDSIEAYFQEAGRAGRDGEKSHAVLLYNNYDIAQIKEREIVNFPEIKDIKRYYQALGNYFGLAIGSGKNLCFDFNLQDFCKKYEFNLLSVYNGLKFIEKEGLISMTDSVFLSSRLHIEVTKEELYDLQVRNNSLDLFIKEILRNYGGLFNDFVIINEKLIANRLNVHEDIIIKGLTKLHNNKVVSYVKQSNAPKLTFINERIDEKNLLISKEHYDERKQSYQDYINAVIDYVTKDSKCRSQKLLEYFGETDSYRCGFCDVCLKRNKLELSKYEFDIYLNEIKNILKMKPTKLEDLIDNIDINNEEKIVKVIQWLLDNNKVFYDEEQKLKWI